MIEIKQKADGSEEKELFINGEIVPADDFRVYGKDNYRVEILNIDLSHEVMKDTFNTISKDIRTLALYYPLEFWDFVEDIEIERVRGHESHNVFYFQYEFEWDFEKWKKPYSIEEFFLAMNHVVAGYHDMGIMWIQEDEVISNGCNLRCFGYHITDSIYDVHCKYVGLIEEIFNKVTVILHQKTDNSLTSIFNFPDEVRVPCEQYLIYFVQFLEEIGIEANASIHDEAGKVLFSVTPTSSEIALEQIHKALNIYLQLPTSFSDLQFTQIPIEPKVQQLIANAQHLNTQLLLVKAIMQANDYTMRNQQILIGQQQKMIDATILQQSLVESKNEKNEDMLNGTIILKKYEGKVFDINLPGLYRSIKNYLDL